MFLFFFHHQRLFLIALWQFILLIWLVHPVCSQAFFQSAMVFSHPGKQFVPVNAPAQLLSTCFTNSIKQCAVACNNNPQCRIFDYSASLPQQCRLFEGDTTTLGSISSSSSAQSNVGIVKISASLFAEYGLPCSSYCEQSRYLTCGNNSTCQCMTHTYWDQSISMCVPQSPVLGASCQPNMNMCREDLNFTCLQFKQCGRK